MLTLLSLIFSMSVQSTLADSGADFLLNSVQQPTQNSNVDKSQSSEIVNGQSHLKSAAKLKLEDPFVMRLFSDWQTAGQLSFELNAWTQKVLSGDYENAAHLLTAIEKGAPVSFLSQIELTKVYLLWKLNLHQTFFNEWMNVLSKYKNYDSKLVVALGQTISPGFDQWLLEEAVLMTPQQGLFIESLDQSKGIEILFLKAWSSLRKGKAGEAYLSLLPPKSPLAIPLSQTVALAYAKNNQIREAAKILKTYLEPALFEKGSPEELASHYINIARLLYQAGSLDGAEQFYEKIPNKSIYFLSAREELIWVLLRKNDIAKLRGEVKSLEYSLYSGRFAPEVSLVRAISNLKLCYYNEVEKDFSQFLTQNKVWAKKISQNMDLATPELPEAQDFFTKQAILAKDQLEDEIEQIDLLAQKSITAVLPSVGPQSHWLQFKNEMYLTKDFAQKTLVKELKRQWSNHYYALKEAIRKMQFVKVELLSQVRMLSKYQSEGKVLDVIQTQQAAPAKPEVNNEIGELAFKYDGVLWPDEIFKLKSAAQAKCLMVKAN